MENTSKAITVEWGRWITVGGSDPRDMSPTEYEGPVLIQFERQREISHEARLVGGQFLVGDQAFEGVSRWKPAPVEVPGGGPRRTNNHA